MEIRKNYFDFYTSEEWEIILEDREKSGLSIPQYCKQKRLAEKTFYTWKNKLNGNPYPHISLQGISDKWKELIDDWKKSGLSKRDYCKGKELFIERFSQWERRFYPPLQEKTALEKWTEIIEDWKKSGLEKAVYCRKKKLNHRPFYEWEKKINSSKPSQLLSDLIREPQSQFEVPLNGSSIPPGLNLTTSKSASTNPKIEVILSQGDRFSLEGPFDWEKLSSWLTPLLTTKD